MLPFLAQIALNLFAPKLIWLVTFVPNCLVYNKFLCAMPTACAARDYGGTSAALRRRRRRAWANGCWESNGKNALLCVRESQKSNELA